MEDKLKKLRSAMDHTVFQNGEFTEADKNRVREKIHNQHRIFLSNPFHRFGVWLKPVLSVLVCLLLFASGIYIVKQNDIIGGSHQLEDQGHVAPSKRADNPKTFRSEESSKDVSATKLINEITQLAKTGKIKNAAFVAGRTLPQEVKQTWGDPDNSSKTSNGIYITYMQKQVTFGYLDGKPVFDLRSYDNELSKIRLSDIRQTLGKEDSLRNFKGETQDQSILVYNLNNKYQLKWIIQKPTKDNPDPTVNHISVYDKILGGS
ncbi:DUF4309 domain-containing protein [Camelliibacillus cellulosilyticus]|uniref:DUF4309 domain-containing protein n=1 Tax=Camelliibacillus cellulosilyticus TaxID=2174486 RepID=A0ABV9GMP1_9BACL